MHYYGIINGFESGFHFEYSASSMNHSQRPQTNSLQTNNKDCREGERLICNKEEPHNDNKEVGERPIVDEKL